MAISSGISAYTRAISTYSPQPAQQQSAPARQEAQPAPAPQEDAPAVMVSFPDEDSDLEDRTQLNVARRQAEARPLAEKYARVLGYDTNTEQGRAYVEKTAAFYSRSTPMLGRLREVVKAVEG